MNIPFMDEHLFILFKIAYVASFHTVDMEDYAQTLIRLV